MSNKIESAGNILAFLDGSRLTLIHNGADGSLRQDRYCIYTTSRWIGPVLEDILLAHQQISIECNSATDNPLINAEGNALHGRNFQAKAVTAAMEKTRQGMQSMGRMLYTQCVEIINPATSRGLPPNLVAEDPNISGILKGTDIHVSALQAELGFLSNPINHVQTAELGNQALNSLALVSTRYTHTSVDILAELAAPRLIALCQAVDLRAMQIEFLEAYRPHFSEILTRVLPNPQINLEPAAKANDLDSLLWAQCLGAFETTVRMDAKDRFINIAKSMRSPFLDHFSIRSFADPLQVVENFVKALQPSLQSSWCSHRDAYLVHGDASAFLGSASKQLYEFVRRSLKIPFLSTFQILTPKSEDLAPGFSENGTVSGTAKSAPTVGSYTGVVYRATRDGTLMKVAISILEDSRRF
ncbi:hypothetical protein MMC17_000376 [Xylographa soralifera]|nr:hypothetical protein [Xylographa soralifera]